MTSVPSACKNKINAAIDSATGKWKPGYIFDLGPFHLTDEPCFVAQEITFSKNSKLVFTKPAVKGAMDAMGGTIYIVCKTLKLVDGSAGCLLTQPGEAEWDMPLTRNLITHEYTIDAANPGAPPASPPPKNPNYDNNVYANDPNAARDGQKGTKGATGKKGNKGRDVPNLKVYFGALVVRDIGLFNPGSLTIDFRGQAGGKGGKGQDGSEGGDGEKGRHGSYEDPWNASPRCTRQPGPGGHGGDGGKGGDGGDGGDGGKGAGVEVYIPSDQEAQFKDRVCIDNSGGKGGEGGDGGVGGYGGKPGDGGDAPGVCVPSLSFPSGGNMGWGGNKGDRGSAGSSGGAVVYKDLVHEAETETVLEPLLFSVDSVNPNTVSKGATLNIQILGKGFEDTPTVPTVDLGAGITVNSVTFNSPSQLTANITVSTDIFTPIGPRDVKVTNPTGVEKTLTTGLTVTS